MLPHVVPLELCQRALAVACKLVTPTRTSVPKAIKRYGHPRDDKQSSA